MKTALIFDIDGTLIDSEGIDGTLFVQAVKEVLGDIRFAENWSNYTKVTDVGILSEILELNGLGPEPAMINRVRERFRILLSDYFESGGICEPLPGVSAFLYLLDETPQITTGIATGGWGTTARMKLAVAGIAVNGMPLSSSDDSDDRTMIMRHCLAKMEGPFSRTVYIGDGLWDRDACRRLGWRFIGIGSKLRGRCDEWFEDFRNGEAVLAAVLSRNQM